MKKAILGSPFFMREGLASNPDHHPRHGRAEQFASRNAHLVGVQQGASLFIGEIAAPHGGIGSTGHHTIDPNAFGLPFVSQALGQIDNASL